MKFCKFLCKNGQIGGKSATISDNVNFDLLYMHTGDSNMNG